MSKKSRLALGVGLLGAALLLPTLASAWWGGDKWRDRDRWYDGPGYYRHGGPGYWGGGPYGWGGGPGYWGGGPGYWGGGPWGWGGYPGYYGYPHGGAPADTKPAPPPLPE